VRRSRNGRIHFSGPGIRLERRHRSRIRARIGGKRERDGGGTTFVAMERTPGRVSSASRKSHRRRKERDQTQQLRRMKESRGPDWRDIARTCFPIKPTGIKEQWGGKKRPSRQRACYERRRGKEECRPQKDILMDRISPTTTSLPDYCPKQVFVGMRKTAGTELYSDSFKATRKDRPG